MSLSRFAALLVSLASVSLATPAGGADGGTCQLVLSRLSYDDPGVDDSEFIELRVMNGSGRVRLDECGVVRLELTNGEGECGVYREFELAAQTTDPRGFFLICASDSWIGMEVGCDLTTSSSGSLKNGWLQNGPGDGLRLIRGDGTEAATYVYGSVDGTCPLAGSIELPLDESSPSLSKAASDDDVIALCNGGYEVHPITSSPLRSTDCPDVPAAVETDGGASSAGALSIAEMDTTVADRSSVGGSVLQQQGRLTPLPWDAAIALEVADAASGSTDAPVKPPALSCSMASGASTMPNLDAVWWTLAALGLSAANRRNPRRRLRCPNQLRAPV